MTSAPMANGKVGGVGTVDQSDFVALRNAYGIGPNPTFDFNDDGQVDQADEVEFRNRINNPATALPPIGYSLNNGVLTIRCTGYDSRPKVALFQGQGLLVATVSYDQNNNQTFEQHGFVDPATVSYIYFYGHESTNFSPTNQTAIPCTIFGGTGISTLSGGTGPNKIYGGTGGDTAMWGYGGNDLMIGRGGHTRFYPGTGSNILIGGPGTNDFWSQGGNDQITDGPTGSVNNHM